MIYSKTHNFFAYLLFNGQSNNLDAIFEIPELFLGSNWKAVLNFWSDLDNLTQEDLEKIKTKINIISSEEKNEAIKLANRYSRDIVSRITQSNPYLRKNSYNISHLFWRKFSEAVFRSIGKIKCENSSCAAMYASQELISLSLFLEHNKSLTFLPLFDFDPQTNT